MPLSTTLIIGVCALLAVALACRLRPRLRERLSHPAALLGVLGGGVLFSALSASITGLRSAGTGTSLDRGWPKPFWFRWESWEATARNESVNALYFAGNAVFWASAVLLLLIVLLLSRRT